MKIKQVIFSPIPKLEATDHGYLLQSIAIHLARLLNTDDDNYNDRGVIKEDSLLKFFKPHESFLISDLKIKRTFTAIKRFQTALYDQTIKVYIISEYGGTRNLDKIVGLITRKDSTGFRIDIQHQDTIHILQ